MKKIFAPGIFLMSQLKFPQKFITVSLFFMLIIAGILRNSKKQNKYLAKWYNTKNNNKEKLLQSFSFELLQCENLNNAVKNTAFEIGKLFNADLAVYKLYDSTRKTFTNTIGEYKKNDNIPKTNNLLYLDEFFVNDIINANKFLIADNIETKILPDNVKNILKEMGIKSVVIVPVFYKNRAQGIILISNTENCRTWKKEDIDLLILLLQQISICIHMFRLNEKLKKSYKNEKILNEIVGEVRKYENHDKIYNLLLSRIINIFNVKRALHLHAVENNRLFIENEAIRGENIQPILHQTIPEFAEELFINKSSVVVINDVNLEIKNPEFKNYLLSKNIRSYLLYFSPDIFREEYNIVGLTLACSSVARKWLSDEMDLFKLIIDATSLVYLEAKRKQEIEDIRKAFVATLTHDLKSPIIAEQKALEFMISRKPEEPLKNYFSYLEDIYRTNNDLLQIVGNILAAYHYESGKFELNIEPVRIEEIVNNSIDSLMSLAKFEGSEISVNIEKNLPEVNADRTEIGRVINNLVSNAIKHNQKGTNICVKVRKINNEIEVSVSDNGKGIPEREKANIFQQYPTKKRKIGTGLGLYLSKQIIDIHGGKIWFKSEEGKGTTFYFTLGVR